MITMASFYIISEKEYKEYKELKKKNKPMRKLLGYDKCYCPISSNVPLSLRLKSFVSLFTGHKILYFPLNLSYKYPIVVHLSY